MKNGSSKGCSTSSLPGWAKPWAGHLTPQKASVASAPAAPIAVRVRADGRWEYLGRLDQQIKLRGLRIEPGEIEARLEELPEVQHALVAVREVVPGEQRLLAYLQARSGRADLTDERLREHLQQALPAYMLPTGFVWLEVFPQLPNGKVDQQGVAASHLEGPGREGDSADSEREDSDGDLAGSITTRLRGEKGQLLRVGRTFVAGDTGNRASAGNL